MISVKNKVYKGNEIDFHADDIPYRPEPRKVLIAGPEYFNIIDVKNPHMHPGSSFNYSLALIQWNVLKKEYKRLVKKGILENLYEIPGAPGCEDMVFAANQSFPWINDKQEKIVLLSKMRHPSRQKEIAYFEKFYKDLGYTLIQLQEIAIFEGMGDLIPHPSKRLLYGGYGFRTEQDAYGEICKILNTPVISLRLVNDKFYHLDTCFLPVSEQCVMIFPGAFTKESLESIHRMFPEVIEISEKEALNFSLNAHLISDHITGKKVAVLHTGSAETVRYLISHGYEIIEVDTSEFIKSGGSVFCMKMMLY